jgi:hypothetical protein
MQLVVINPPSQLYPDIDLDLGCDSRSRNRDRESS